MSTKNTLILIILVAIGSAVLTRYLFPRIETQTVEVTKEVVKVQDHTITKIVTNPDGTTTTVVDETKNTTDNKVDSKTETTYASKDWQISGSASGLVPDLNPIYGVQIQRRILGPFYLGALANTNKEIGVSLGFEF